jgi:hypothetical protein
MRDRRQRAKGALTSRAEMLAGVADRVMTRGWYSVRDLLATAKTRKP